MKPLTIEKLWKDLTKEMEKGHNDYIVFVTDDEEANGYHALWFIGTTPDLMTTNQRKYLEETNCDLSVCEDTDKAYYLG